MLETKNEKRKENSKEKELEGKDTTMWNLIQNIFEGRISARKRRDTFSSSYGIRSLLPW